MTPEPQIAYFVPDLGDPAVSRRVEMLITGGARVDVTGFLRGHGQTPARLGDAAVLGRTQDAALAQRALAVLRQAMTPWKLARRVRGRTAVIARNLEMLALARLGLAFARSSAPLTYECLDVHRVMTGEGPASRALRALEGFLMRRVSSVVVSSPAFDREYFARRHPDAPPRRLIENKVFAPDGFDRPPADDGPETPPWRIGWYGNLRCSRSLAILAQLAAERPGAVEIHMRGRPSPAVFTPDLETQVADMPGVFFHGAYTAADLPRLYGEVHFVWGLDFYEEGLNSAWLLPNRLYEGSAYGRPVIAQQGVETGEWLDRHGAGVRLSDITRDLATLMDGMTQQTYSELVTRTAQIPVDDLVIDAAACRIVVSSLCDSDATHD